MRDPPPGQDYAETPPAHASSRAPRDPDPMSLGRRGARLVTLQACAAPPGCCPHPSLAPADPHRSSSSPPTSTHLSHRPGQPSPLGMCSGLRQGHRCPHSGRGRNADSSHHVGLTGRLRVGEGSSLQPVPRRAGPWGLQAARPMPRPRPGQATPNTRLGLRPLPGLFLRLPAPGHHPSLGELST